MTATILQLHATYPAADIATTANAAAANAGSADATPNITAPDITTWATQIVLDLITFAERHALPSPSDEALQIDGEVIATWPPDLWRLAFRTLWETWTYRRMPAAGDFRSVIAADLATLRSTSPDPFLRAQHPRSACAPASTMTMVSVRSAAPTIAHPQTVEACIAALRGAGAGTITTWKTRARSRNPELTSRDLADMALWVPVIADLLAEIGLYGSP